MRIVFANSHKYVTLGASSVMVARGALWNASIFSPEGKVPWEDVKREYIRKVLLQPQHLAKSRLSIDSFCLLIIFSLCWNTSNSPVSVYLFRASCGTMMLKAQSTH